jgi:hypothetical protein
MRVLELGVFKNAYRSVELAEKHRVRCASTTYGSSSWYRLL